MKIRIEQLGAHLSQGLAPLYMVYGDEPLLVQEVLNAIRSAARDRDYQERECLTVEPGFNWNALLQAAVSPSLFAARRILELRLGNTRPDEHGAGALQTYAGRPAQDAVLLISAGKLDQEVQQSRWLKALDAAGVLVQVWPVDARQLPAWIERRMLSKGLHPASEAVALLAERVEGNLLAAAQEIDKLHLWLGGGAVTAEQLLAVVSDSARYNVYDLVDAALAGQPERTVRILHGLCGEGVEAVLVLWALHREIRLLATLAFEREQGQSLDAGLTRNRVWEKRKPLVRRALQRLPGGECRRLLRGCARVDRLIKGVEPGDPWDGLLQLSLGLAGRRLLADFS